MSLAGERFRRYAVDRDWHRLEPRGRAQSYWPAQSAPRADGPEHGLLSGPDVERPLLVPVRQPVRQQHGLPVPRSRGDVALVPAASPRRSGVHPADGAGGGCGFHLPRRQRRHPRRGRAQAERGSGLPKALRQRVPRSEGRRADHVRDGRPARSPSSSSRSRSRMLRSIAMRAASGRHSPSRRREARCSSSARRGA